MNENLDMRRLFRNRCPACGRDLAAAAFDEQTRVLTCPCGYSIEERKMQHILAGVIRRQIRERQTPT